MERKRSGILKIGVSGEETLEACEQKYHTPKRIRVNKRMMMMMKINDFNEYFCQLNN